MQKQIQQYGDKEWKSEKEIYEKHKQYNTKGKANVIGYVSKELAEEITGVSYVLYVVTLGYNYFFTFVNGYVVIF